MKEKVRGFVVVTKYVTNNAGHEIERSLGRPEPGDLLLPIYVQNGLFCGWFQIILK
jgi:hypothetical protein